RVDMGVTGTPAQRSHFYIVLPQSEVGNRVPGERTEVLIPRFHTAKGKVAFIASAQKGVGHIGGDIGGLEFEGDLLVVPKELTTADFESVNRKREQLLDGRMVGRRDALHFRTWQVGAAVGIDDEMSDGVLKGDRVETETGFQQRDYFDASNDAIH